MGIIDRRTRLKARRAVKRQKRQVESITAQADDDINRLFFKRLVRLKQVRRFFGLWTMLVLLLGLGALWQVKSLDKYYLVASPVAGGTYREGIMGSFTNANPLFATSSVDLAVSKLVFSGLFKISPDGEVEPDLASSVEAGDRGIFYTVKLRDDVIWQDGEKFNADDVLFTYQAIQNPNARSSLKSSWEGVKITKVNDYELTFELPSPLGSFPYSLTNGIVPKHILGSLDAVELRSSNFNTVKPVGTGPFTLKTVEVTGDTKDSRQERVALSKFDRYFGTEPYLDNIVIRSYRVEESMLKDFDEQVIQSMVGLSGVGDEYRLGQGVRIVSVPLTSSVMVFMNNSAPSLTDKNVRLALVQATDGQEIRTALGFPAIVSDSPFLKSQFAYDSTKTQLPYNKEAAEKLLDDAGWIKGSDGKRAKDGNFLTIKLVSQSLSEYASIAQKIQKQWADIGVTVEAVLQPEEDIQAGAISRHDYDVLIYGISIGYDPDVFAYWHSSQADARSQSRLNLSEYKSTVADSSLEAGRTRVDKELRSIKYKPFLEAWRNDAPAIALYQPRFLMVVQGTFEGFDDSGQYSTATDRFWSVTNWQVRKADVVKSEKN